MTTEHEIWKRLNKLECVKKVFGAWRYGDFYTLYGSIYQIDEDDTDYNKHKTTMGKDEVWIPPLYDPVRPERSLIEILYTILVNKHDDGWRDIKHLYGWAREEIGRIVGLSDRPDLALAKVILEQKEKG